MSIQNLPSQHTTPPGVQYNNIDILAVIKQVTGGDFIIHTGQWQQAIQTLCWNGYTLHMAIFTLLPYYRPETQYQNIIGQSIEIQKILQTQIDELTQQQKDVTNKLRAAEYRITELEIKKKKKWFN